jgi:hypothetical protein
MKHMANEQAKANVGTTSNAQAPVATPIYTIMSGSVIALAVETVMLKARSHGKEKGNFSVEYFCEDMLADALKGFSDYIDADRERKDRELFVKACNALTTPDMTKPDEIKGYVNALDALKRKYRQGSYKPKDGL